jgi:hypothetical protein
VGSLAVCLAAFLFTWARLFVGMDVKDEAYYVVLPWRWVLGERPFSHEQTLFQLPALLEYPFLKLFGLVRGNDPTGLILYTRHLYLLMMLGVALAVFQFVRRMVRWQFAAPIAATSLTFIFWATPNLSYDTMAIAFLTLVVVFECRVVVLSGGWRWALASGAAAGAAVVAYPTLIVLLPLTAAVLVAGLKLGPGSWALEPAGLQSSSIPHAAGAAPGWRSVLLVWLAGVALVLVPVGLLLADFGLGNVLRGARNTAAGTQAAGQLGGLAKLDAVLHDVWLFVTSQPFALVALLAVYLVYRRRPRAGRLLLAGAPVVLFVAGQRIFLDASGYVLAFVLLAPYLFLFIPASKKALAARLLLCVWAVAVVGGVVTSYTSAAGYVNAAVGAAPGVMVSALFLAWALEAAGGPSRARACARGLWAPTLTLTVLAAVVAVTIAFQFQYQQHDAAYSSLTSRFDSGPWWGIAAVVEQRRQVDDVGAALAAVGHTDDSLLVLYVAPGYYLFWPGPVAAYTYWMGEGSSGGLPPEELTYLRTHNVAPTVLLLLIRTRGLTEAQLRAASDGLAYRPVLVRPGLVVFRRPGGVNSSAELERLESP